jgi:hypothetical protein
MNMFNIILTDSSLWWQQWWPIIIKTYIQQNSTVNPWIKCTSLFNDIVIALLLFSDIVINRELFKIHGLVHLIQGFTVEFCCMYVLIIIGHHYWKVKHLWQCHGKVIHLWHHWKVIHLWQCHWKVNHLWQCHWKVTHV